MSEQCPGAKLRVLVVDDYPDLTDTLVCLIEIAGHEAKGAYDGHYALRVPPRFRPQLVILDLNMPGMHGHEVARRMRQLLTGYLHLVAHSARSAPEDVQGAITAGFHRYVTKPISSETLSHILNECAAEAASHH